MCWSGAVAPLTWQLVNRRTSAAMCRICHVYWGVGQSVNQIRKKKSTYLTSTRVEFPRAEFISAAQYNALKSA